MCQTIHTIQYHVGLETVTNDNIEKIMTECLHEDKKNKPIEEQKLKDKKLQDGIRKVINENK